jgi:hypothetical protein
MRFWSVVVVLLLATPAVAQTYPQWDGERTRTFASPQEVAARVGDVRIEVVCPASGTIRTRERGAHVFLTKAGNGYRERPMVQALLRSALYRVWEECPVLVARQSGTTALLPVGFVDISAPDEAGALELVVRASGWGQYSEWFTSVRDLRAVREREVAAAQERAAMAARAEARAVRRAQAAAEQERLWRERDAGAMMDAEFSRRLGEQLLRWAPFTALGVFLLWLWSKRDAILYRFYMLTPHPAAARVHAAIRAGSLDGPALAQSLAEMPSNNRICRAVRMEQATQLVQKMQAASRAEIARIERQARTEYERAAVLRSQEAVALAAAALARAQAAHTAVTDRRPA